MTSPCKYSHNCNQIGYTMMSWSKITNFMYWRFSDTSWKAMHSFISVYELSDLHLLVASEKSLILFWLEQLTNFTTIYVFTIILFIWQYFETPVLKIGIGYWPKIVNGFSITQKTCTILNRYRYLWLSDSPVSCLCQHLWSIF